MVFQIEEPPTEERDVALGQYMDAWSRLETILLELLRELLHTDDAATVAVGATLGARQLKDLLNALAALRMRPEGTQKMARLCNRFSGLNTKRNHIIHGRWAVVVHLRTDGNTVAWVRSYTPVDPALAMAGGDYTKPKIGDHFAFTIKQLRGAQAHVSALMGDASAFIGELPSLRLSFEQRPQG